MNSNAAGQDAPNISKIVKDWMAYAFSVPRDEVNGDLQRCLTEIDNVITASNAVQDELTDFMNWKSRRGEAANYQGDGIFSHIEQGQWEAYCAGIERGRAVLAASEDRRDAERLDWIAEQGDPKYRWIARQSSTGRGFRLHNTTDGYGTPREAIDAAIAAALVHDHFNFDRTPMTTHNDESLKQTKREIEDIHRATAAEIFGVEREVVDSEQRRYAKVINFGLLFPFLGRRQDDALGIERASADNQLKEMK